MDKTKTDKAKLILLLIWLAWVIFMVAGCMTPQKATGYLKEKGLLADTCAANYPVLPDTVYKEGEIIVETTFLPGDTLYNYDTVTQVEYVTVTAPTKVITRHKVDSVILTKVDSAKVAALQRSVDLLKVQVQQTEADLFKAEDKAKDRGKASLYSILGNGLLLLVLGFILAKKRKP
mgnify:CR=1 FL=1